MGAWESEFTDWLDGRMRGLLRYAHMLTGNPRDAEDLLQDVLIRVSAHWAAAKRHDPDAYVRRALTNQAITWARKRRREAPSEAVPDTTGHDTTQVVADQQDVRRALASLPMRQRATVVLRYYEDY